jgi:hypothetical protein
MKSFSVVAEVEGREDQTEDEIKRLIDGLLSEYFGEAEVKSVSLKRSQDETSQETS